MDSSVSDEKKNDADNEEDGMTSPTARTMRRNIRNNQQILNEIAETNRNLNTTFNAQMQQIEAQRVINEGQAARNQEESQALRERTATQAAQIETIMARIDKMKKETDINLDAVSKEELHRAENQEIFKDIKEKLVYPLGRDITGLADSERRHVTSTWERFARDYSPKLTESSNIPRWLLAYENSCDLYNMDLEFRYKKLLQTIMDSDLRARHASEMTTIYDGIDDNARAKYKALRTWLAPKSKLRNWVMEAKRQMLGWTPGDKSILENIGSFKKTVHSYRYQVRFAHTHGVRTREFNNRPKEAELVQLFCARSKRDKIRIKLQQLSETENLAVLTLICEQLDTEITIPLGYKKEKEMTASIFVLDEQSQTTYSEDEANVEFLSEGQVQEALASDEQVLYIRRNNGGYRPGRYRNNWSRGNWRSRQNNRGSYRGRGRGRGNFRKTDSRANSGKICTECIQPGHTKEDCFTLKKKGAYHAWLKLNPNASTQEKMQFVLKPRDQFRDWTKKPTEETPSIMAVESQTESKSNEAKTAEDQDDNQYSAMYGYKYPRHL